jgi:ubiquitin carboxyl-terminal hydrolase 8
MINVNYEKYNNKGLSGLCNLGNTCFINSCMQVLSHTYELNDYLETEKYKEKMNDKIESALLVEWDNLRKIMWKDNCVISPGKFITTIQQIAKIKKIDIFTGFSQNDVSEFLLFLIDCFHNSISRKVKMTINGIPENEKDQIAILCFNMIEKMYKNEYSEIWNLFYAVHVSQIRCLETNKILNNSPEPFFIINLPIPENNKNPSLYDCFDLYIKEEVLEGPNAWYNENTKKYENVKRQILFWSFPNILVIDLKRFFSNNNKNQKLVNIPINNLDLSKYVIGYKKDNYIYDLYGICNHSGSVHGGHYTAYVKNANNKWYSFNDTNVSEINNNMLITPKAYCLFYRKKIMQ